MVRRQRTPRLIDNGHGWRSDAIAYEKAGKVAQAIRFPKGWLDCFDGSGFHLSPLEVLMSTWPSNDEKLHGFESDGGNFLYNHIVNDVQCLDLGELVETDMTPAQRHWLGALWNNKTDATKTALTCRRQGRNAPEGVVAYEKKLDLHMEGREFWLDYKIEILNVYVMSGSRGNGIGHALLAPIALEFRDDIRHLKKAFDRTRLLRIGRLDFNFTLGADIASEGGRAVYDSLYRTMCGDVEETFTPAERRRHIMSDLVEEETCGMYFDPDEVPVERTPSLPDGVWSRRT